MQCWLSVGVPNLRRLHTHPQLRMITNRTLKIVKTMSECCGLRKHEKTQHALNSDRIISQLIVATRKYVKRSESISYSLANSVKYKQENIIIIIVIIIIVIIIIPSF